jgi:alpha-L-rhamnosidase
LQTRTDKNGLISHEEPNGWCLGDWCTPTKVQIPEPFVNTAYYYHVTDLMAKVAWALGKKEDRAKFINLAQQIKTNFNTAYFNPTTNAYWQSRQGAEVFALAFGLVDGKDYNNVFNSLLNHLEKINYHFDTGILATPLLLKVLAENDRDDIAYKIMDQKDSPGFAYLLDSKNSTLWESWNGSGSHAHPMFGSVVEWLYSSVGGIKAEEGNPGLKHFIISPKPVADLTFCKSSYNSLYGKIRSEWKTNGKGNLDVLIEIPQNTSATFVLPGDRKTIKTEGGQDFSTRKAGGKYTVELKAGVYRFKI